LLPKTPKPRLKNILKITDEVEPLRRFSEQLVCLQSKTAEQVNNFNELGN